MKNIFIFLIGGYQKIISPLFKPSCRYYPTCSQYSVEAISKFGVIKGIFKSILRILRCNPFSKGGYDPIDNGKLNG